MAAKNKVTPEVGDLYGIAVMQDLILPLPKRESTAVPPRRKPGFWHSAEPQAIIAVIAALGIILLLVPVLFAIRVVF